MDNILPLISLCSYAIINHIDFHKACLTKSIYLSYFILFLIITKRGTMTSQSILVIEDDKKLNNSNAQILTEGSHQ